MGQISDFVQKHKKLFGEEFTKDLESAFNKVEGEVWGLKHRISELESSNKGASSAEAVVKPSQD